MSGESINSFNKRENIPATEIKGIELNKPLAGDKDNPISPLSTGNDTKVVEPGDPDNVGVQLVEKPPANDRQQFDVIRLDPEDES